MDSNRGPQPGERGTGTTSRRTPAAQLEVAVRFVRLFSLGATVLYPVLGVAAGEAPATGWTAVWAVVTGLVFHVYADVGNDVMDLPIDRSDPRRSVSPLVRGDVSPQAALVVALVTLPVLLGLIDTVETSTALGSIVAAVALIGLYNVAGKMLPVPIVADIVQGLGWAALVFAGSAVAGGITATTVWVGGAVVVYITMVNGVHGAVRDAANDRRAGARTTAIILGADVVDEVVLLPASLVVWTAILQIGFGVALVGVVLGADNAGGLWWSLGAGAAAGIYLWSLALLVRMYLARSELRQVMGFGTWHLFLIPLALLAAVTPLMEWWLVPVSVVAFVLPPQLFAWSVRRSAFTLPSTSLPDVIAVPEAGVRARLTGLWHMARPGTPLAGAVLVAVGAELGGSATWSMVPLMIATAAAVAAGNVFNDRCDVEVDAVNRPDRPLVAGPTRGNDADKFVLVAAIVSVAAPALIGLGAALVSAMLLVIGLGYSLLLRRLAFLGQATVAVMFSVPVAYGAWFVGGEITVPAGIAVVLTAGFVFAREVIKGIPDLTGDQVAGYRTPATSLGRLGALWLFRVCAVLVCGASLGAYLYVGNVAYLAASLVCVVGPTIRTMVMVRGKPTDETVDQAVAFSGLVFASGVVPLLLLG